MIGQLPRCEAGHLYNSLTLIFDLEAAARVSSVSVCVDACVCTLHRRRYLSAHTAVGIVVLRYVHWDESSKSGGQACAQLSTLLTELMAPTDSNTL